MTRESDKAVRAQRNENIISQVRVNIYLMGEIVSSYRVLPMMERHGTSRAMHEAILVNEDLLEDPQTLFCEKLRLVGRVLQQRGLRLCQLWRRVGICCPGRRLKNLSGRRG